MSRQVKVPLFIRMSKKEKKVVQARALMHNLQLDQFAICKMFDIPFETYNPRLDATDQEPSAQPQAAAKATA